LKLQVCSLKPAFKQENGLFSHFIITKNHWSDLCSSFIVFAWHSIIQHHALMKVKVLLFTHITSSGCFESCLWMLQLHKFPSWKMNSELETPWSYLLLEWDGSVQLLET